MVLYIYFQRDQHILTKIKIFSVLGNSTVVDTVATNLRPYIGVFVVGQILHGVGGCVLFSLGFVFLDSNVSNKASPIYVGMSYSNGSSFVCRETKDL